MLELAGLPVQPAETLAGGSPQQARGALTDRIDAVVGQRGWIGGRMGVIAEYFQVPIETVQAARMGADPDRSVAGLLDRTDIDVTDCAQLAGVGQKGPCLVAVVSIEPFPGTDPEHALVIEQDGLNDPCFEPLAGADGREISGLRRSTAQQQQESSRQTGNAPEHQEIKTFTSHQE